jgi:actin-related protein
MGLRNRNAAVETAVEEEKVVPTQQLNQVDIEDLIEEEEEQAFEEKAATREVAQVQAQQQEARMPATHQSQPSNILQAAEDDGFSGLALDFTSFDIVKLDNGEFECSDGSSLGNGFEVVLQQSAPKYTFVSRHKSEDEKEVKYSDDEHADLNDPTIMAAIKQWKEEDGVGYDKKKYLQAAALVVDDKADGVKNNEFVMLQIPPASVGKFSGLPHKAKIKGFTSLKQCVVRVNKGKKVENGGKSFTPWEFTVIGAYNG